LLLGEAYSSLQKFRDAEQILSEADQMARDESEKISVIQARSLSLLMHGHTEEALQVNEIGKNFTTSKLGKELLQINEGAIRCLSGEPAQGVRMLECLPKMREGIEAGVVADAWLWGVSAMNTGMVAIGRADDAIHFSTIAHELHAQLNNHTIFLHPIIHRVQLVIALTEAGRIPEARATMRESLARAEAEHEVVPYMLLSLWGGRLELIAGHVEQARRLYMEASVRAHAQNGVLAIRLADAGLAASASLLDDTAAAQAVMDRTPLSSGVGLFAGEDRLGEAWVHVSRGELAQARLVLTQAADTAKSSCHLVSEAMLLTDIARLGGAQDVTGRLEELAKRCDGSLTPARSRFVAALATKDPDRLVKSADELGKLGIDLLAAEAATTAAAIWRRLGQPRKATIATEHAETYSARCQGAHTPLLAPPEATAALTTREREIALLAVSGATSKDIASALGLSVRTVDNHLQHTYTKLGITTRRELVKALASRPSAAKKAGN
jgi:DNA-binding CsgD family transcriptional regulator